MSSSPHVSGHVSRSSSSNNLLSLNAAGSGSSASLLTSAASLLASPSRSPPSSVQNRSPSTSINGDMNTRDPRSNTGTPSLSFAGVSRAVSFRSPAGSVASNLDKLDTTNVNEDLGEVLPIQISGEGDSNRNSRSSSRKTKRFSNSLRASGHGAVINRRRGHRRIHLWKVGRILEKRGIVQRIHSEHGLLPWRV